MTFKLGQELSEATLDAETAWKRCPQLEADLQHAKQELEWLRKEAELAKFRAVIEKTQSGNVCICNKELGNLFPNCSGRFPKR